MTSSIEWWSIGVGLMGLLIGLGVFMLCLRAAGLLGRIEKTLDEVDRQIPALSAPVVTTLTHVGGIADTADTTIARLGVVVGQLEVVAGNATTTVGSIGQAVSNFTQSLRRPKHDMTGVAATPTISGAAGETIIRSHGA